MRPRRRLSILAVTGMLLIGDPVAAARAGAVFGPATRPAALPADTAPAANPAPERRAAAREITVARRARIARALVARKRATLKRAALRRAALRRAAHKKALVRAKTAPKAVAPPRAPQTCAEIVATIAWPDPWGVACTGPRAGVLGLTSSDRVTTLYVRPDETLATITVAARHEAGHAWDLAHLDGPKIALWCAQRGCDAARFFSGGDGGQDWSQPGGAEDWASVWNACHAGSYDRSYLGLAAPTAADCAVQDALVGFER
jgi:hypothetical protein